MSCDDDISTGTSFHDVTNQYIASSRRKSEMLNDPNLSLSETELKEIDAEHKQARRKMLIKLRKSMPGNPSTQESGLEDDDESMASSNLLVSPNTSATISGINDGEAGQLVESSQLATNSHHVVAFPAGTGEVAATASTAANVTASASSLTHSDNPTQDARKLSSNLNCSSFATSQSLAAVTLSTDGINSELKRELDVVAKASSNQDANPNRASFAPGSIAIHCEKQDDLSVMTGDNDRKDDKPSTAADCCLAEMSINYNNALSSISETTEAHFQLGQKTHDSVNRCEEMLGDLLQKFNDKQEPKLTKMTKTGLRSLSSSEINSRKTKQPSLNFYAKKPPTVPKGPGCLERAEPKPKPKSSKKKVDTSQQERWKY